MIALLHLLAVLCGLTILLESIPVLFVRDRKEWWKASVVCNIVTNPIANVMMLLASALLPSRDWDIPFLLALEITIFFLETFFYHRMLSRSYPACFAFSLAANLISFGFGLCLQWLPSIPIFGI